MSRILFIAPTRIGDAILAAAALRYICEATPQARVTIATSSLAAPLFAHYPTLERIHIMEKQSYSRHWLGLWADSIGTVWDAVWDMRSSALAYLLITKQRRIFRATREALPKVHQMEQRFGVQLPYPTLWCSTQDEARAAEVLPEGTRYFLLAPIANWAPKEWPITHYTQLALELLDHDGAFAGFRPVIACAPHEADEAQPLVDALAAYKPITLYDAGLSLTALYACFKRCAVFVGNDSGLMHMAAAASIPTLGLFGPTPSDVYQPWGAKTALLKTPDLQNLAGLSVDAVKAQLIEMLA